MFAPPTRLLCGSAKKVPGCCLPEFQYIKGPAIHLSYVDRRTDVFCLVNK